MIILSNRLSKHNVERGTFSRLTMSRRKTKFIKQFTFFGKKHLKNWRKIFTTRSHHKNPFHKQQRQAASSELCLWQCLMYRKLLYQQSLHVCDRSSSLSSVMSVQSHHQHLYVAHNSHTHTVTAAATDIKYI